MPKASKQLLEAMNGALSEELASTIQYLWQHIMARGLQSPAIADLFKQTSMVEMDHAYKIAERIHLLGGTPTTAIGPVKAGGDLKEMLEGDLEAERVAVRMYQDLVKLAEKEGDVVTARLAEEILGETEEHEHRLAAVLEKA